MSHEPQRQPATPLSPRTLERVASPQDYEALLQGLAPGEPERAAAIFERLRTKVLRFFAWRSVRFADQLADEVMGRLARKAGSGALPEAAKIPAFARTTAANVLRESQRWQCREQRNLAALVGVPRQSAAKSQQDSTTETMRQLETCLDAIEPENRRMILAYFEADGANRIAARKRLAYELGLPINALRLRISRIRRRLERCLRAEAEAGGRTGGTHEQST